MKSILYIKARPYPAPRPRVTRRGTYNKKEYSDFKDVVRLAYVAKHEGYPTTEPIAMKIDFFYQIPKSWSKKKKAAVGWHTSKPDVDNIVKSILDALNGVAFKDDSQVCFVQARKQYASQNGIRIEFMDVEQ